MLSNTPKELLNEINEDVLKYIQDLSAHDGVVEELVISTKPLGDVQVFCPDWKSFRYVVSTHVKLI